MPPCKKPLSPLYACPSSNEVHDLLMNRAMLLYKAEQKPHTHNRSCHTPMGYQMVCNVVWKKFFLETGVLNYAFALYTPKLGFREVDSHWDGGTTVVNHSEGFKSPGVSHCSDAITPTPNIVFTLLTSIRHVFSRFFVWTFITYLTLISLNFFICMFVCCSRIFNLLF